MERLAVLPGDNELDESMRTFVLFNESHTLGNALTSIISKYRDVEFCGYTMPHPAEAKVHLRIQTVAKKRAVDILNRALEHLEKACDDVIDKFEDSLKSYRESKEPEKESMDSS